MTRRPAARRHAAVASDPEKALAKLLRGFAPRHHLYTVFCDFVEVSAIAFSNAVDKRHFPEREARYLAIVGKYAPDEANALAEALGLLTLALEAGPRDVLGSLYMLLELGNEQAGQFFTPFEVSVLMAGMLMTDPKPMIERLGFIRLCEPACGAGGMVLAAADTMLAQGCNPQRFLHATCTDVSLPCVHMTYLQLALAHIPAVVLHGNSLSLEVWSAWQTPAHVLGGWNGRLAVQTAEQRLSAPHGEARPVEDLSGDQPAPAASVQALYGKAAQLGLF